MFRNLRINIIVFYVLTVTAFLSVLYYALEIIELKNHFLLLVVLLSLVVLSAVFISKLAVDPLQEYVRNLQSLSKETLHELNLPISTITTNTQMLQRNLKDEKNVKRAARIESACEMLQQRYNELDYIIKMQTKQEIKEHFSLDELVTKRVAFLQKIYPHIKFTLVLSKQELYLDKIGLSKVIDNLIDNGVKYSQDSKNIDITIEKNRLLIRDYGIGMNEVELLAIFDNYYQINSEMKGFGIGLNMVKRFCDENNIELIFDSVPDKGTTVQLKFKQEQ
ncbi:sensor histidine kinase [Sulfurimonas paralvinellae]|uniref:histidine kinase n=1 Tax=Sulfurimonas paralvinellae TaxID=317658 RepID=A0A7M1B8Z5_9BACT|nr:HAMP domain-containing sensor histidine kinase [Sulfurimonas paralvinellae]QOP45222.1 HAMP domain-containing histidine kinase [Sulfurimonas paralvinellae]